MTIDEHKKRIYDLEYSHKSFGQVEKKLKTTEIENAQLKHRVSTLSLELMEKKQEKQSLKDKLFAIQSNLNSTIAEKERKIESLEKEKSEHKKSKKDKAKK